MGQRLRPRTVRADVTAVIGHFFSNPVAMPTMPELATRLVRSLARDDLSVNELAGLIGGDASLSTKMLRMDDDAAFLAGLVLHGGRLLMLMSKADAVARNEALAATPVSRLGAVPRLSATLGADQLLG